MKSIYKVSLATLMMVAGVSAYAQNTNSGYFMENYLYRHQMNPAFGNTGKGFVGFPGLGNVNVGVSSNFDLTSVLYTKNGKTMLFTNPEIPADEVLSKLNDNNKFAIGAKLGIIDLGFKAFGGYNTIGVNVVANGGVSLPGAVFKLLKEGIQNKRYDIMNFEFDALGYAEIALNHSRDIKQVPGLRVGATMKFLVGVGSLEGKMKKGYLELGEDSWNIATDAEIYSSIKGFSYDHSLNTKTDKEYVSGAKLDNFSAPNGFGLAFDLGAEYKWNDFRFSAAVLDLGFIHFGDSHLASSQGMHEVRSDAFNFELTSNGSDEADDEWDRLADDFSELYQLTDMGNVGRTRTLKTTLNFGVEYELPVYRKVRFGLLNTTRIYGHLTDTEFRLSANLEPTKWFGLNVNGVAGSYGAGFGWMLNLRAPGFNFFAGMDHVPGKFIKPMIPTTLSADFFMGIDFPF